MAATLSESRHPVWYPDNARLVTKGDDAIVGQPVRRPADEPLVHIVLLGLLGGAGGDVGLADAAVYVGVLPVLVVVVFVLLVGVVGRVADDYADGLFVLLLDANPVFLGEAAEVEGPLPGDRAAGGAGLLPVHVIQGVHEAQVGEFQVAAGLLAVAVLDVQVGDVVGQDGDFVGVDFVQILALQPVRGAGSQSGW